VSLGNSSLLLPLQVHLPRRRRKAKQATNSADRLHTPPHVGQLVRALDTNEHNTQTHTHAHRPRTYGTCGLERIPSTSRPCLPFDQNKHKPTNLFQLRRARAAHVYHPVPSADAGASWAKNKTSESVSLSLSLSLSLSVPTCFAWRFALLGKLQRLLLAYVTPEPCSNETDLVYMPSLSLIY